MSEFGVDFVVGRKMVTVAGLAKGSKDTFGHLFEHLVHLPHLAIDKTLFMVFVLIFLEMTPLSMLLVMMPLVWAYLVMRLAWACVALTLVPKKWI